MASPGGEARLLQGRYRLLEALGHGGMGTVWQGRDETLGRDVAIKEVVYPPSLPEPERRALRERTLREARAIARMSHTAVVTVYDVVSEDERPWIVMELIRGRSLDEVLQEDGPLDPVRAARVGLELLGALQAAHAEGVIHRDVKPGNVLLADDGRVVLTDFGIASVEGDPSLTSTGLVLGSPAYMAPERARGDSPGPASDLWALGATLYAAVEGRPPFVRATAIATLGALVAEPAEPAHAAGPLAPALDALLVKDPVGRADARRTADLLRGVVRGATGGERPTEPRRARVMAAAVAVAVLALGGVLAFAFDLGGDDRGGSPTRPQERADAASTPDPEGSSSPSATPTPTGSPTSDAVPAGFVRHQDPTGFSVAVPRGWREVRAGSRVDFRKPGGAAFLRIDQTRDPAGDPVRDWKRQERAFRARYPSYHRLGIEAVSYRGYDAADWRFTFRASRDRYRVLNRAAVTAPDHAYAIYWSTEAGSWPQRRDELAVVLRTFKPAR